MLDGSSYGTLLEVDDRTLEFRVNGRVSRTWTVSPPVTSMSDLVQRCLTNLANDGWRPISHQAGKTGSVVLARVPYTAGSKLSTFGTLRFLETGELVLTVSGAVMRTWCGEESRQATLVNALSELQSSGWRVHRQYRSGATVVRG